MAEDHRLAEQFEANRGHLRAVAYRMLGSLAEADDAVQEAWLRLNRSDMSGVANPAGWLTTVVGRICLDMLRARTSRREEPLGPRLPDPVLSREDEVDPEGEAVLADSVGLALLVVLQTLSPAERLAFVLHDMFGVPFDQIAPIVDRSPTAARQLASRARRRVRGAPPASGVDRARQRQVVDAFQTAAREGDFEALVAVLDPDVVLRADVGRGVFQERRGPVEVARGATSFAHLAPYCRPALVNGTPGIVVVRGGRLLTVLGFTVAGDRIVEIDILADPQRLRNLDLSGLPL
jgi:RNA polymerase sigma factor (sigma-70 family)